MPFTPSHAVVALPFVRGPLARLGLVPAAIAVGAMTPDLPLFVRGTPYRYELSHDLRWLPVTVLVALVLLLVWRCVLRPAVRELSPRWLAARLPIEWDASAGRVLRQTLTPGRAGLRIALLLVALALGAVTHVVWDDFTHVGRAGSEWIPALAASWGLLPGYKWLQYGSSVLGLVVLAVSAVVWLRRRPRIATPARVLAGWLRIAWWISLPIVLVIGVAVGYAVFGPFDEAFTPQHLAYRVLPSLCSAWGMATVVLCVAVQAIRRVTRTASA